MVEVKDKDRVKLNKDEIEGYIKQKPNTMILSYIPFNAWLYFQIDQEKMMAIKEKRNEKYDEINKKRIAKNDLKNQKRIAKGKKPREPKLKDKDKPTIRERLLEMSEVPIIYDSALTKQTSVQIQKYMQSKGYFSAKVVDTVIFNKVLKTCYVFYNIYAKRRKYVRKILYDIQDTTIAKLIREDSAHSILQPNIPFDVASLNKERERVNDYLQNNGYYYFAPEFIQYDADSISAAPNIDITMHLNLYPTSYSASSDSMVFVNHPKCVIKNIYFIAETFEGNYKNQYFKDTLKYNNIYILHNKPIYYNVRSILSSIKFQKGEFFNRDLAEESYRQLLNIGIFRSVLIQFDKADTDNELNCYVICQPIPKQFIGLETQGTNTSANLGIDGSLIFQNRSVFGGGEKLEFKVSGALIAQKQVYSSQQNLSQTTLGNLGNIKTNDITNTFNTIQIGPELKFSVPREFFPFSLLSFKKDAARTYFNVSTNYQTRSEFSRTISSLAYGFQFSSLDHKYKFELIPSEIYMVKASLSSAFQANLLTIKDYLLLNSFISHITNDMKATVTFNTGIFSNTPSRALKHYLRCSFTGSGILLRQMAPLLNLKRDTLGRYEILNMPFAHFLKTEIDYRVYVPMYKKSKLVYRAAGGIGIPLKNLSVLPYEQSFFAGGPNSVRAWRSRSIGPGSYMPVDNARYDKIGDILIEGNIEYRFNIFGAYNGAIFADAGNIWLLQPNSNKPNGEFNPLTFWNQFAVGAGLGFRWDFEYFILRLDAAMPIKDPKYPEGQRWMFNKQPLQKTILNFGIGYPF